MKKLFVLLSMMLLTACIAVDDFGTAWDNAGKDPSLMGRWAPVIKDDHPDAPDYFQVVDNGKSYRVHPVRAGKKLKEKKDQPALKTMQIGDYSFILGRDTKVGSMIRYKIQGDVLSLYSLSPNATWLYVGKKFPRSKAFERETDEHGGWDYLRIRKLDDETQSIVAGIPDNEYYWHLETKFRRAPDTVP